MIILHLILYLPAAFVVMRYSAIKLFMDEISENLPLVTHTIVTLTFIVLIVGIVLMLNGTGMASGVAFSLVMNLNGGVSGTFCSFILPTLIYLKMFKNDGSWKYREVQFIHYLGYIIMFLVGSMTILGVL